MLATNFRRPPKSELVSTAGAGGEEQLEADRSMLAEDDIASLRDRGVSGPAPTSTIWPTPAGVDVEDVTLRLAEQLRPA